MSNVSYPPREYAEWFNFWVEKGSDYTTKRVMLIGDSIVVGYRKRVQELFREDGIYADQAAGSRCAGDPAYEAEIEYALGAAAGYKYDVVHLNNGLHGGCNDTLIPLCDYEKGMRRAIEIVKRCQPEARLILATSTPMRGKVNDHGTVDPELNGFVLERNEVVKKLASEYGLDVDDLFAVVAYKPEYTQNDGVHFDAEGKEALAQAVYGFVKARIN